MIANSLIIHSRFNTCRKFTRHLVTDSDSSLIDFAENGNKHYRTSYMLVGLTCVTW